MNDQTIAWLLEKDNPSVRYFALRYLLDRADDDRDVQAARRAIMRSEPVRKILAAQNPEGYWVKPGSGYSPKYQSTAWQILFLAELGADGRNKQIRRGVEYYLEHAQATHGGFSAAQNVAPSLAVHCLNGNLIWALVALGYGSDERVARAVDWLAGAITGDDFRWFNATVPGPGFKCGVNMKQPCAWGAVKSLRALANLAAGVANEQSEESNRADSRVLVQPRFVQSGLSVHRARERRVVQVRIPALVHLRRVGSVARVD